MLHVTPRESASHNDNDKPVALSAPLQYRGHKLNAANAIAYTRNQLKTAKLALASATLNNTIGHYAKQALPIGLSVQTLTTYSQLSPSERTCQFPQIMTALHEEFNAFCESVSNLSQNTTWDISFNSGSPTVSLSYWFCLGHLKEETEHHLLRGFISAFAQILAENYGALTQDNLLEYAYGNWGDFTEVKSENAFLNEYHNIIGDLDEREGEDEKETVTYINDKYASCIKIHEYFGKHQIESTYESLKKDKDTKQHYTNTHELLPALVETVDMWQLWHDAIAVKLINDVMFYQTHLEAHEIESLTESDNSGMWQHVVLINDWETNITQNTYEAADSTCNDTYNNGHEMKFNIDMTSSHLKDDLDYLEHFTCLIDTYFDTFWQ